MFSHWSNIPEIQHLDPPLRKAAWQAGFGAVSARPIFWLALGAMAVALAVSMGLVESVVPGWPGRLVGAAIGALVGGALYDAIMRRAMRPHILQFLEEGARSE